MISRIVLLTISFFFFINISLFSDDIIFRNGDTVSGVIVSVDESKVTYMPEGTTDEEKAGRNDIDRLIYSDGTSVILPDENKLDGDAIPPFGVVWNANTKPLLLPFLLRFDIKYRDGNTAVEIFDRSDKTIASGDARMKQYECDISYEPLKTDFFYHP